MANLKEYLSRIYNIVSKGTEVPKGYDPNAPIDSLNINPPVLRDHQWNIPSKEIKEVLDAAWGENLNKNEKNLLPHPQIVDVIDISESIRQNLDKGDLILVRTDDVDEQPIGNYVYGNLYYDMSMELYTRVSRQRLYDMINELRRIIHKYKFNLPSYQRMTWQGFAEGTDDNANIWIARTTLVLENNAAFLNV